jgi:hypothetical protein
MSIIAPGNGILFMKVGTHAQETLADIIKRKKQEIADAGHAMWGYGGNTCHPRTMVQPFGERYTREGRKIYLCMEPMLSNHFAEPVRADEYSADGRTWQRIPDAINVRGSRYALLIKDLRAEEFMLSLNHTTVAVGNSMGRLGGKYVKGRVDKACLEVTGPASLADPEEPVVSIGLVAELMDPYAVFLRNT